MEPSFKIQQVQTLLREYRNTTHRVGIRDIVIWQSLEMYYAQPEEHTLVVTSTQEEAFDRMVKDDWHVRTSEQFAGIDYQATDEQVLEYLLNNQLATRIEEEQ